MLKSSIAHLFVVVTLIRHGRKNVQSVNRVFSLVLVYGIGLLVLYIYIPYYWDPISLR